MAYEQPLSCINTIREKFLLYFQVSVEFTFWQLLLKCRNININALTSSRALVEYLMAGLFNRKIIPTLANTVVSIHSQKCYHRWPLSCLAILSDIYIILFLVAHVKIFKYQFYSSLFNVLI